MDGMTSKPARRLARREICIATGDELGWTRVDVRTRRNGRAVLLGCTTVVRNSGDFILRLVRCPDLLAHHSLTMVNQCPPALQKRNLHTRFHGTTNPSEDMSECLPRNA